MITYCGTSADNSVWCNGASLYMAGHYFAIIEQLSYGYACEQIFN